MAFTLDLDGDRRVDVRLAEFPQRARAALRRRIDQLTSELLGQVVGAEPHKTGALEGETRAGGRDSPDFVLGYVRIAAKTAAEARKAGALEYGASRPAQVPSHVMRLGHIFGRQVAPLQVIVEAYSRPMNMAARRYLRGPLDGMRSEIRDALHETLEEAMG